MLGRKRPMAGARALGLPWPAGAVWGAATATEMPEPRLEQLAPDAYAYTAAHDVAGEPLLNVTRPV